MNTAVIIILSAFAGFVAAAIAFVAWLCRNMNHPDEHHS